MATLKEATPPGVESPKKPPPYPVERQRDELAAALRKIRDSSDWQMGLLNCRKLAREVLAKVRP